MPTSPPDVGHLRAAEPPTASARRPPRPGLVWTVGTAAAAALVVGVAHVPTGRVAERPGSVLDLAARVTVTDDTPVTPIDGRFDGLTVSIDHLDVAGFVRHALTGDPSVIVPEDRIRPPDIDPDVYRAYQKAAFVDGGQVAAAVAERALGEQVSVTSEGLEVFDVLPDGPANTILHPGDVIVRADGRVLRSDTDLQSIVERAGDRAVVLTVRDPHDTERTVSIVPALAGDGQRPVIGAVVAPSNPRVDLAVAVDVDATGVVGPSAGLMTALTVYDMLSPTDVAAGRVIAGTGTLAFDGTVGDIGGIEAKARAAESAGADLFLAPADQAEAASDVLGDRVPVIGVATFDDALAALGTERSHGSAA